MKEQKTKFCKKCDTDKKISDFYYHRQRKHYMESCKECNKKASKEFQKKKIEGGDVKFILTRRAAEIRYGKKGKEIPVAKNLSKILNNAWNIQHGKCFYSGEPMDIQGYLNNNEFACTVDRKIPELGYVEGNIVLCCAVVNKIKTNLELEKLFEWIEKIKKNLQQNETATVLH